MYHGLRGRGGCSNWGELGRKGVPSRWLRARTGRRHVSLFLHGCARFEILSVNRQILPLSVWRGGIRIPDAEE